MNFEKPSEKTLNLLLKYEVGGGKSYYEKYLSEFTWPGGASGPTIAIGIDCAYYTVQEIAEMFSFLQPDQIKLIQGAVGKKGESGKQYTSILKNAQITVDWEKALQIFYDKTWSKFSLLSQRAFPGLTEFHEDAYGAIVSLVFNRGTSMKGDSRKEMRVIKDLVPSKNYKAIAEQIRAMKRLWEGKNLDGLLSRREAEAVLIESCI